MSDIEKLFLSAYPLWPKQLIERYSSLLSLEVARFNPTINSEIIDQYKTLGKSVMVEIKPYTDNVNYILAPSNGAKIKIAYYGKTVKFIKSWIWNDIVLDSASEGSDMLGGYRWYMGKIFYDQRIFATVNADILIQYNKYAYEYRAQNYVIDWGWWVSPIEQVKLDLQLNGYNGASTVLAMMENGVAVDVDQKLLFEFVTFINAYNKYVGELAAANSLQAEKNRQAMTDYKNSISEKLNSRKNELNDLRTQISFAAKNETASAKRDMQSLTLSAQSLMIQLQDKLK